MLAILLLALGAARLAVATDAWHLDYINILTNELLDPVVTPNALSSHMHKVLGGSGFKAAYNYNDYNNAKCTSLGLTVDKSNYWEPTLYWIDSNSSFVPLPANFQWYYFLSRNDVNTPIQPFPKGLRMVAGSSENKAATNVASFTCHQDINFINNTVQNGFDISTDCPGGLKIEVYFPPCWDGINLYKSDNSHMSYPWTYATNGDIREGPCPVSHPVKLPAILLSSTWLTYQWSPGTPLKGHLAWANGDTTGFGVHADFVNGWDIDVLTTALSASSCGIGGGEAIPITDCPVFQPYMDYNAADACAKAGPDAGTAQEPFGNSDLVPIPRLPGCNPLWGATGSKPTCATAPTEPSVTPFLGTDGNYTYSPAQNIVLPTTPGWQNLTCIALYDALTSHVIYSDSGLTIESCTASCLKSGYSYAATGLNYGGQWECVCATGLASDAPVQPGMCTQACPGNSGELCGSQGVYKVFYAPPGTTASTNGTTLSNGATKVGCYSVSSDGLLNYALYSFSSSSMTNDLCSNTCLSQSYKWAATEDSNVCYCGNSYSYGSGNFVPDAQCTMTCAGNSTQYCGDSAKLSLYNITSAVSTSPTVYHPAGWQGCYQEGSGTRALTGPNWWLGDMTPQHCLNYCSELGYTMSAVEAGYQCFCGSSYNGGQWLPSSTCATACSGNSSAVCGGSAVLDLYNTSYASTTLATLAAKRPGSYQGCFYDANSNSILTSYSYTSASMTPALCLSACSQFGYSYAGLENGNQCNCGNTMPATSLQVPTPLSCTSSCSGNSSATCGSSQNMEVYKITTSVSAIAVNTTSSTGYIGCYSDPTYTGLSSYSFQYASMTVNMCRSSCLDLGYKQAALLAGNMCNCGNSWGGGSILPSSSCSTPCVGSSSQICGATSVASLYNTTGAAGFAKPVGWQGCYSEGSNVRALSSYGYSGGNTMDAAVCRAACANLGYTLAGTEYYQECYCANALDSTSKKIAAPLCDTPCYGNSTESCGGSSKLDVYTAKGGTSLTDSTRGLLGCYSDGFANAGFQFASSWMSVDICNAACYARGYAYSGLSSGSYCSCSAAIPSNLVATSQCNNACSANSTENCGTTSAMAVYNLAQAGTTSGDFVIPSADSTGYIGCFAEGNTRVLPYNAYNSGSMSNSACQANCATLGYAYAGSEYGSECWCTNKLNSTSGGYEVASTECTMSCSGGTGICGGSARISVFTTKNVTTTATATVEGLKGCYSAGTFISSSALSYYNPSMSTDLCRRTCNLSGYTYAGLSAGGTCSCGSSTTYGTLQAPAYCGQACYGNSSQTCGSSSGDALSLFDTTGAGAYPPSSYGSTYVGCIQDANPRVLNGYSFSSSSMSSSNCIRVCAAKSMIVSGTENGNECYCSSAWPSVALLPDSSCTSTCSGSSEICGGSGRLSVYNSKFTGASSSTGSNTTTTAASSSSTNASSSTSMISSASITSSVSVTASASASSSSKASSSVSSSSSSSASAVAAASASSSASSSSVPASSSSSKASVSSTSAAPSSSSSVSPSSSSSAAASSSTSTAASSSSSRAASSSSAAAASSTSSVAPSSSSSTVASSSSAPSSSSSAPSSSSSVPSSSSSAPSSSSSAPSSSSSAPSSTSKAVSSSIASSSTTSSSAAASSSASATSFIGCYTVSTSAITDTLTCSKPKLVTCQTFCNSEGYKYAGMTNNTNCACFNDLSTSTVRSAAFCNLACNDNASNSCGSSTAYSIYTSSGSASSKRGFETPAMPMAERLEAVRSVPVVPVGRTVKHGSKHANRRIKSKGLRKI